MYGRLLPAQLLLAMLSCALLVACNSTPSKDLRSSDDPRAARVLTILDHFLFPAGWDNATRLSMAKRITPLEYHGDSDPGSTLIQSLVLMDDSALDKLLGDARNSTTSFRNATSIEEAFGLQTEKTDAEMGLRRQLNWWHPGKHKGATYYVWGTETTPKRQTWLQVSDEKNGKKRVYIRIESE